MVQPSPHPRDVVEAFHRDAENTPQGPVQAGSLLLPQLLQPPGGMDVSLPQNLVGEEVAHAGQNRLVHQHGLDPTTPGSQRGFEPHSIEMKGIWTQRSKHGPSLSLIMGQPQPAELAHVPVPELAAFEFEDDAVVAVTT
jgi:hypothetical protein